MPTVVDEGLATFLGYLIGEGHLNAPKDLITFTMADQEQASRFATLVQALFGLDSCQRWDHGQVIFPAPHMLDFLKVLGLETDLAEHLKQVPEVILRSPKPVVTAFLRAYYDCAAHADSAGLILSTSSRSLAKMIPLLLLNFGILSHQRQQQDGPWHLHIIGPSAKMFQEQIGFDRPHKQEALQAYLEDQPWPRRETWTDEVVAIERRRADVYDISVVETHAYAAQGLINHNSYWHSTIMTQKALTDSELIRFADQHAGVVATNPGHLNPYKLGLELLRDIEERWNKGKFGSDYETCDDIKTKLNWDQQLGLGREKIFEVRRLYNDITFIDAFLTPEFMVDQKLFNFEYNPDTNYYEIVSRDFAAVKEKLLKQLTNLGQPYITVEDGNYRNRGELYLRHRHDGVDLRMDYARDTLHNLHLIWTRPVYIETVLEGRRRLFSFDGKKFTDEY